MFAFLQVFLERVGCFSVEKEMINLLRNQEPPFERSNFVQACGSVAMSRGLRVFTVHNGSECLAYNYSDVSATLPRLHVSRGCLGGRGGKNVTDVYRFTSRESLPHSTDLTAGQFLHQLSDLFITLFTYDLHTPCIHFFTIQPFTHNFAYLSLRMSNHSFIHLFSQSLG